MIRVNRVPTRVRARAEVLGSKCALRLGQRSGIHTPPTQASGRTLSPGHPRPMVRVRVSSTVSVGWRPRCSAVQTLPAIGTAHECHPPLPMPEAPTHACMLIL